MTADAVEANPNKALWEKGDFTRIAATMRDSGEQLVKELGIADGLEVLDLGCGDGTTAVPAARLGANVLGVDIASNLVEAGNARARSFGLTNLSFQEGDASDLRELEADRFDLVISIFGAMFAPRPFDVAREMVRVTRPGGRIVMGKLDRERSDIRGAVAEDQRLLLSGAPRRLHQPGDMGRRGTRAGAIRKRRGSRRRDLLRASHLDVRVTRPAV
jgi:2-polyprenyl-3-methyl-5-hydroxy-6-metoxy-1,4-benzoquinol methylase